MNKQEFFKENDEIFLPLGFVKDEEDPMFHYVRALIPEKEIEESGMDEQDVPKLLYGSTGINRGFCVYTGAHFIWLNCSDANTAIRITDKIVAFEEV